MDEMLMIQPDIESFFAALADPTRVRLLGIMAGQAEGHALCVGALATRLGVSQPAVSQHLRVLRVLGLVRAERRGVRVHYLLDRQRFREWCDIVEGFLDGFITEHQAPGGSQDSCTPGCGSVCAEEAVQGR